MTTLTQRFYASATRISSGVALAALVSYTVYDDAAGTSLADAATTSGGSAVLGSVVTASADGELEFFAEAGTKTLWLRCPAQAGFGVQEISAHPGTRLDLLETGAVNVKTHGALGNFSANETASIHAARDAAGAGGRVFFPSGTYLHDGLDNNQSKQVWELAPGAVLRLKNTGNAHTVTLSGAGSAIVGGRVDGNKANQTGSPEASGVFITGADCRVEGVEIINAKLCGIQAKNATRPRILRNTVTDSDYVGMLIEVKAAFGSDIADALIEGNYVDRSSLGSGIVEGGIKYHGDTTRLAIGGKIRGNTVRMPASPSDDSAICIETHGGAPRTVVQGNVCYGGSMSVSISTSDYASVTGNTGYGPSLVGYEAADSEDVTFAGNTLDGNALTASGFSISNSTPKRITITGTSIKNLAAAAKGIYVNAGERITITGNTVDIGGGNHCIVLQNSTYFTITGNTLIGTAGSFDGVSSELSWQGTITGNTFIGLQRSALFLYAPSAVTIINIACVGNAFIGLAASFASSVGGGGALGAGLVFKGNVGEAKDYWDYTNNRFDTFGTGTPEGAVTAGVSSTFRRTDGGAATCLYVKESGTGNTGWVAK